VGFFKYTIFVKNNNMADKKFFIDVNMQGNNINNLRADTLDIITNLASANTKRIAYYNGSYYYSDGTSWNILATALGYTPEDQANKSSNTSLGTSNILYPTQNAVKVYADNLLGNANALIYKGVIDCSTNPNYPAADAGWMYIASIAGKIGGASGTDVEVGDMIICNTDGTVSGNQATVGQYWNIIQKNIIGAVTGPSSSVNNNVVFFDGVTGKIIKDSGLTLSGTNTGDETTATIKTKLGAASSSTDGYLTSTDWSTFNGKQNALSGTGFVKISGTTINYDNSTYLTANQNITLSGDISGSGSTSISTSISASTVTGKLITGFVSGAGTLTAADSILTAVNKLDGNIGTKQATLVSGTNIKTVAGVNLLGSGDIGTIGDTYISSATTWNSKQAGSTILTNVSALSYASGTPFIKMTGVNTFALDTNTYLTGNQTVTLSGDVTGSGATGITTSISATTVTGKLITGFVSGAGTVAATDSILGAIQKLDGNTSAKIGGSGTANYVSKFTASGTIGNSLIQDNGTYLGISTAPVTGVRVTVDGVANTAIRGNTTGNGKYGLHGSSVNDGPGTFTGVFGASTDNGSSFVGSVYVGGRFFASNGNNTTDVYSLWLQDGTESIGKFLKSITADGKSQWATLAISDVTSLQTSLDAKSPIASPTFTGTVTSPAVILSSETANTIASFDASKNIKSLSTATYPSLTELSYGKGVTSSIQTQLDAKSPLNPRVQTVTSSATVTPVSTNDLVIITAQAVGLTLANPTGTFAEGQSLMIRIKDNGTARAITFGTNYRAIGITLPSTTVISKTMYLGIIYNSTDGKWDILGLNQQA